MFGKFARIAGQGTRRIGVRYASTQRKMGSTVAGVVVSSVVAGYVGYQVSALSRAEQLRSTTKLESIGSPQYATKAQVAQLIDEIRQLIDEDRLSVQEDDLLDHSDNSSNFHKPHDHERPYLVTYPKNTEEVQLIVKICYRYKIPMIPIAGKTSIEGHMIPTQRGILIDISLMDQILEFHEDDLDVVVGPGINSAALNEYLSEYNLVFGPDACSGALIGGMCATNASGTLLCRYGATKDNIIGLKVVLADGTIVKTKNRPRKSSAGYNLTNLFVGSEGTLGIIVELTLKLNVKPETEIVAMMNFDKLQDASNSVIEIFKKGIQVNSCELLDSRQMKVIKEMDVTTRKYTDQNLLLFKFGGSKQQLKETAKLVRKICENNNGVNYEVAYSEEDKRDIWDVRKSQLWISIDWAKKQNAEMKFCPTDSAVPVSKLTQAIEETVKDIEDHGLLTTVVAHLADGNFHALVIFPPEKLHVAELVIKRMAERLIKYGGTCSGEHGVGIGKREFLKSELGEDSVDLMRSIKLSLDPYRLFNPDKIFQIDPNEKREDKF